MKLKTRSVDVTHAPGTKHAALTPQLAKKPPSHCRQEPRPGREVWEEGLLQKQPVDGAGMFRGQPAFAAMHGGPGSPCASSGRTPGWAVGILSGENSCDPCWTWGETPNFSLRCWHLCKGWAQKGGIAVSSAGHRETSPEQGASAKRSWSPPSPHLPSLPLIGVARTGLGMSPAECHPLQPCALKDSCSSVWQLETASPAAPLYTHVAWKWNFQLVFSPLKINWKQLGAIQLNY